MPAGSKAIFGSAGMLSFSPTITAMSRPSRLARTTLWRPMSSTFADRRRHAGRAEADIFRADAEFDRAGIAKLRRAGELDNLAAEPRTAPLDRYRHDVHARRADEITDESVLGTLEELSRRADLHDLAVIHDDDMLGEGQRLGLVVRDIDHRVAEALVELLQLRAQHPFHVRVDDGQRLVEEDRVDVVAHQPAAERDLLLLVGGKPPRPLGRHIGKAGHFQRLAHAAVDIGFRHARGCAAGRPDCRRRSWCRR